MEGWVKLHRCLMEKTIWIKSTPEQKVILVTILMLANHKGKEWEWNGEKFITEPGQFITSLDKLVTKCGVGIKTQNIRTALARFEKLEFLTNQSTKTGRLITVVNWHVYQANECEPNIDDNKDLTKSQQRPNKDLTPNKNDKTVKNDNKNIYSENLDLNQAVISFIEMRKSLKKPMTDNAIKLMLNKLNKFSADDVIKTEILNHSIMSSWTDIYELKQTVMFNDNGSGRKDGRIIER